MRKRKFVLLILVLFLCSTFLVNAQAKHGKTQSQATKKLVLCKSNKISFPCPNEYKILLNGNDSTGIFLAQSLEFRYSLFVIAPKDNFDEQNLMTEMIKMILKTLYPNEFQGYGWKNVEYANYRASSKFEVSKKLSIGFNGDQLVTVDYRNILNKNKRVIVGTIVDDFVRGTYAETEFLEGRYATNGGCFDAVKIIHSITGEKDSKELDTCGGAKIIKSKD